MFDDFRALKPFALAIACFGLAWWLFTGVADRNVLAWVTAGLGAAYTLVGVFQILPGRKNKGRHGE